MKKQEISVTNNSAKPVAVEVLAESIVAISRGIKKLREGPLNERALILLIQDAAGAVTGHYSSEKLSKKEIRAVLDGIEDLEKTFIKRNETK